MPAPRLHRCHSYPLPERLPVTVASTATGIENYPFRAGSSGVPHRALPVAVVTVAVGLEFLSTLSRVDLGRVDVALRVGSEVVNPVELPGVAPVAPESCRGYRGSRASTQTT